MPLEMMHQPVDTSRNSIRIIVSETTKRPVMSMWLPLTQCGASMQARKKYMRQGRTLTLA